MKQIRIYFTDFWPVFNIEDNFFLNVLKKKFDVIIDKDNPDFLFYSCFGKNFLKYNCVRVFFSGENYRPDFTQCDWSFSSDYIESDRSYRLPIYFYIPKLGHCDEMTKPRPPVADILKHKTKFCNFVYSNPRCKKRNDFFHRLSQYKWVDSGGKHLNNLGYCVGDKVEFLKDYKFTIAFENSQYDGYTTEKIFEPFVANSIPIYWGNPFVNKDFNTRSFLNYYDFPNEQALIERIIEIDNDDNLFAQYVNEPVFTNNKVNKFVDQNNVLSQLEKIFTTHIEPVSNKTLGVPPVIKQIKQAHEYTKVASNIFCFQMKFVTWKMIVKKIKKTFRQLIGKKI